MGRQAQPPPQQPQPRGPGPRHQHRRALAFTDDQASSKNGLVRLVARYQAWLFFPLLLLEAAHLHLASIKAIVRGSGRANLVEGLLLLPMSPST